MNIKIAWLYPDLMSTYGDRGNIISLKRRCEWRKIDVNVEEITLESDKNKLFECDLIFMGGAQDRQQKIASDDLFQNKGPIIKRMIEDNTTCLFVCAAYQFMGKFYQPAEGDKIPGLGIFDLYTIHPGLKEQRCIGNIIVENSIFLPAQANNVQCSKKIVGFENHGGRTYLGKNVFPFATVIKGYGNNGEDKTEGAIYKSAYGTYLHGPILPKNPHFADFLIEKALCKKYQKEIKLGQINDELEWRAHQFIIDKIK